MSDREHRVSGLGECGYVHPYLIRLLERSGRIAQRRPPAAARNEHDPETVRPRWIVDVQQQCRARVHSIDNVLFNTGLGYRQGAEGKQKEPDDCDLLKTLGVHL
jgi:hypothetical protein